MITITLNDLTNENKTTLLAVGKLLIELSGEKLKEEAHTERLESAIEAVENVGGGIRANLYVTGTDETNMFTTEELCEPIHTQKNEPSDFETNKTPMEIFGKNAGEETSLEHDSRGLIWDARIHSRTKSKNKDGTWKAMRNLEENYVKKVEAEQIPSDPIKNAPIYDSLAVETFPSLIAKITNATNNKQITRERVIEILQTLGVPNVPALGSRLDLLPKVAKLINTELGL